MRNEHKCGGNMDNIKLDSFDFYRPQNYSRRFFFFMLISTVFAIVVPLQRTAIILENLIERQNHRDRLLKFVPCTATFIKEHFEDPDQISLLLPEVVQNISDLVEPLISELRTTSAIYTLNIELIDVIETYDASANAVILLESASDFKRNDSFTNYCKGECNFLIVLTTLFIDEESFLMEADILAQQMWLRSVFKLAVLASVEGSVLFANSFPVRIGELYAPGESTILGKCEQEASEIRWQRVAQKAKSSFEANTINAAMFENFPYAIFPNNTDSRFGGVEGVMVEEIVYSMGIKLNRELIKWTNNTMIETELNLRFYNATNDLVFGGLLWSLEYFNRRTEYTTSYGMVHITWVVPIQSNVSLRGLIAPFSVNVWFAIICAIILGGLAKIFFIRDISFLDIAALILSVGIRQPKKTSSRIQFISWSLFGFFLTQFYLGSLADQLVSATDAQIETVQEIVSSGLKVGGTKRLAELLQTPDKADEENNVIGKIRENFITFEQHDYIDHLMDIVEGKNTTLALLVMLNLTDAHHLSNLGRGHIIKETMGSYPLALATWEGFPYLLDLNFKIQITVQAGLVDFWSRMTTLNESYYETDEFEDDKSTLELDDLAPAFLLLIIGHIGGYCLFIIEVILYPSKIFQ